MQFNEGKVVNKKQMAIFISSKQKEVMDMIRILKVNPGNWKKWVDDKGLWYTAQEIIMLKHGFGKYKNLCPKCLQKPESCNVDRMYGSTGKNVCYCESYNK